MRMQGFSRTGIMICLVFLAVNSSACGKKGPPTLASYKQPEAPVSLTALHREGSVILRWNYPKAKEAKIREFILLKSTGEEFNPVAVIGAKERSFEDTDIKEGRGHWYKIIARNQEGVLSNESNMIMVLPAEPPQPPSGISRKIDGMGLILNWEPVGSDVSYNIYRGHEKGRYDPLPVNNVPILETSFRDTLDLNRPVYYAIRTIARKTTFPDEGPLSKEVIVSPDQLVPFAPQKVTAFAAPDAVYLTWDAPPEPWIFSYRIYRKIGNGEFVRIGDTQIPTYADRERPVTPRDYRISAVGPVSEGQGSEVRGIVHIPEP